MTAAAATANGLPRTDGSSDDGAGHSDAGAGEGETAYRDLLAFLSSGRADVRRAAAAAALAVLAAPDRDDAARRLTALGALKPLCRLASGRAEDGGTDALAALALLCAHDLVGNQCILDFVEEGRGVGRMLEIALSAPPAAAPPSRREDGPDATDGAASAWDGWRRRVNFACALLANATRTEPGAADFIGRSLPAAAVPSRGEEEDGGDADRPDTSKPTATLLLARFLNPAFVDKASPAHAAAAAAWDPPERSSDEASDYDSDLDDDALERDAPPATSAELLALPAAAPTMDESECYDPYQHVAAVLVNITQLVTGREFLLRLIHPAKADSADHKTEDATTSHLQALLPQLTSPNVHRRRGVAGTLKNCCFSKDSSYWLLDVVRLDKALLLPLAGPEELTLDEKVGLDPDYWLLGPRQRREPDALVRRHVAEALLLLLAAGRRARETLRARRTYVLVKLADMVEEDEGVSERLLECVQYLRRDEEGTGEGSSDQLAYETYARGMLAADGEKNERLKALPPSTTVMDGRVGDTADNYDNID